MKYEYEEKRRKEMVEDSREGRYVARDLEGANVAKIMMIVWKVMILK